MLIAGSLWHKGYLALKHGEVLLKAFVRLLDISRCQVTGVLEADGLSIKLTKTHTTHDAARIQTIVEQLKRKKLEDGARDWKKAPAELWAEFCGEVRRETGNAGIPHMGKQEAFKRTLLNKRIKNYPAIPKTRADFQALGDFPERFTKTRDGGDWLRINTSGDPEKELIIGFMSDAQRDLLKESNSWSVDGTFACVEKVKEVQQLWVIVADTPVGVSVPCGFFLTGRKTEKTYTDILEHLRDDLGIPAPKKILCDFEKVSRTDKVEPGHVLAGPSSSVSCPGRVA